MKYWLSVAPAGTWEESIRMGLCGAPNNTINRYQWNKVEAGDMVLFYATSPVKGLIGAGKVTDRMEEDTPLWLQEKRSGSPLWPLRMRIRVELVIPRGDWTARRVEVGDATIVRRSLMPLSNTWGEEFIMHLKNAVKRRG